MGGLSLRLSTHSKQFLTRTSKVLDSSVRRDNDLNHVAIVGGGIAGLCTAISLVCTANIPGEKITIFEPRMTLDKGEGAGLNLNCGAAILSREYGIEASKLGGVSMSRAVSMMYTQTNSPKLFDIDFKKVFNENSNPYLYSKEDNSVHVVTILRENLLKILHDQVLKYNVNIKRGPNYKIKNITEDKRLIFQDDSLSLNCYDLIIGADGVKSKIRKYINQNNENSAINDSNSGGKYTGVRVAWILADRLQNNQLSSLIPAGQMRQYICDGGTCVAYAVSKKKSMIAFLYREKKSGKENTNFTKDESDRRVTIAKKMKGSNCPDEFIKQFESKGERFIESSVYEHASLPSWSHNRVVLVGDAAHAMAPFLGQGANQTIQDAHMLGLALRRMGSEHKSIDDALQSYEDVFKDKVGTIRKKSRVLGFLYTQKGISGHMLRKGLLLLSKGTGFVEKDIITAFQPRFQ